MNGGAEVVHEAGEGKGESARAAAGDLLGFEDFNCDARLCENDSGGEAVGAGADDAGALHKSIVPETRLGGQADPGKMLQSWTGSSSGHSVTVFWPCEALVS